MAATVDEAKALIAKMCKIFYKQGWVSGTGGGISVRVPDESCYVVAPSGVQKEQMEADDMYVISEEHGTIVSAPIQKPWPARKVKISECLPLFTSAYELRNAGAVLHSHAVEATMVTMIDPLATEFRCTNLEMIKGIHGHGYTDMMVIPIIENTARESELTDSLRMAIKRYPKSNAVLVRRHGIYIWGDDWISAKTQAECYHYIFQIHLESKKFNIDISKPVLKSKDFGCNSIENGSGSEPIVKAVVLDIEGTVCSINYVSNVLFTHARGNFEQFLRENYESHVELQNYVQDLIGHVKAEIISGMVTQDFSIPEHGFDDIFIQQVVNNLLRMMDKDMKTPALKNLQGLVWKEGFKNNQLCCPLFEDVIPKLQHWKANGVKIYIYSSGSRLSQRMLFAHTDNGDVTHFIDGYFDTINAGNKFEIDSYKEIALTIGLSESPNQILFHTDSLNEYEAAVDAGWQARWIFRQGNKRDAETVNSTITQHTSL